MRRSCITSLVRLVLMEVDQHCAGLMRLWGREIIWGHVTDFQPVHTCVSCISHHGEILLWCSRNASQTDYGQLPTGTGDEYCPRGARGARGAVCAWAPRVGPGGPLGRLCHLVKADIKTPLVVFFPTPRRVTGPVKSPTSGR